MTSRHRAPSVATRGRLTAGICLASALIACGAPAVERPASEMPRAYPGVCTLIGIEEVAAPLDQPNDTVAVVARYRFGKPAALRNPFAVQFEIARARAYDLRLHLAAQPTVVCRPDERSAAAPPVIELTPFEGQSGRPLP